MRKKKCKISRLRLSAAIVTLILIVSVFVLAAVERIIEPKIRDICSYYCKSEISRIVSDSIYSVVDKYNIDYEDMAVKIIENGKICSVDIRTENVNKLQSEIIETVSMKLEKECRSKISIPLGNVSDLFFLSGRGPEIEMQFLPEAAVTTEIKSEFSSAGINQTRHTLSIEILVEAIAVLPTENIKLELNSSCILAESIFMGDIPHGIFGNS